MFFHETNTLSSHKLEFLQLRRLRVVLGECFPSGFEDSLDLRMDGVRVIRLQLFAWFL